MQSLKLDFVHPFPRPHWAAWVLLAAGLGLASWVGWQGRQAQSALEAAKAAAPQPVAAATRRPASARGGEEQAATRQAREQLMTPWGDLFARLETNVPKGIALVALEADARKPEATLTAEARTAPAMLAWVERLKGDAGFASVTLVSHALQENDPQRPLRFVLRLVWRS